MPCDAGPQRFLLARHGQTTFNAERRFQGSLDEAPVLTERGVLQARELGAWLAGSGAATGAPVDAVFTSPLLRARQTLAEVGSVAGGLPAASVLTELREIDLHEWEGRTQADVKDADPEGMRLWKEQAWNLCLGGGKHVVRDLWERASLAWSRMRDAVPPGKCLALVVAHGTLGKALMSTALGLPVEAFRHFKLANGEVVEIAWPIAPGKEGVFWRKRYPVTGPWRSFQEEAYAFAAGQRVGSVDVA